MVVQGGRRTEVRRCGGVERWCGVLNCGEDSAKFV